MLKNQPEPTRGKTTSLNPAPPSAEGTKDIHPADPTGPRRTSASHAKPRMGGPGAAGTVVLQKSSAGMCWLRDMVVMCNAGF